MNSRRGGDVLTRRRFLRAGLAAAAMAGGGSLASDLVAQGAEKPATPPQPAYVDAHVHVWTADPKYPLATGYRRDQLVLPSFTGEDALAEASGHGVRRMVLIQTGFYGFDNSYMVDTIAQRPGVFVGVALIDDGANSVEEMRRLKKRGVRGVRLAPGKRDLQQWGGTPGISALWRYGAEQRAAMCLLIDPGHLPAVDRLCRRFPETPVVIDHLARIGADGVVREQEVRELCGLARHRHVTVKVSAFYYLGKKQYPYLDLLPMIRLLLDAYGASRLMWASDSPYQLQDGHTYRGSIELIRDRLEGLSAGDRQALLGGTAERVFFS